MHIKMNSVLFCSLLLSSKLCLAYNTFFRYSFLLQLTCIGVVAYLCVCVFTWPEPWLFIIGGDHHMWWDSIAIWCHQGCRISCFGCIIEYVMSAPCIIGPIYLGYVPFHSEGELIIQLDFIRWRSIKTNIFWKIHVAHSWRSKLLWAKKFFAYCWIELGLLKSSIMKWMLSLSASQPRQIMILLKFDFCQWHG